MTRQGVDNAPPQVGEAFDAAVAAMAAAGATIIDLDGEGFTFPSPYGEFLVLLFDFKVDLEKYFATRAGVPMAGKTLADAIAFNEAHAAEEMPFFRQEIFELAQSIDTSSPDAPQPIFGGMTYNQALEIDQAAGVNGIDLALSTFHLDGIVAPTDGPAWTTDLINGDHFIFGSSSLAAAPGYPIVQVPSVLVLGMPRRHQLLRDRVQRVHAHQARLRLRGRYARAGRSYVRAFAALRPHPARSAEA